MKFTLKCCGRENPIGVDKQNIRLSFALSGSIDVSSYQVELREQQSNRLVCTLQVSSGHTLWIDPAYLKGQTAYLWYVVGKTKEGASLMSDPGYFETGPDSWQGSWIGGPEQEGSVLAFQKEISIDTPPERARLYICGLGYFRAALNGKDLDDTYFIPPVTNYAFRQELDEDHAGLGHRVSYYTYDVTRQLQQGSNILAIEVAGGYYSNQEKKDFEPQPDFSFGKPSLFYELHIEDGQGNQKIIVSDRDTQVRCTNQISQLYSGDRIDFARDWSKFVPAVAVRAPEGVLTAPQCPGDKVQKIFTPVTCWQTPEGTIYDFGVNHSGGLRFSARSEGQTELVISYAEVLQEDGTLNLETSAWHGKHNSSGENKHIYQKNRFILKPGENEITPKFSWFCYRYVLIPNHPGVEITGLCSLFLHMDLARDGSFQCGEGLLEKINQTFLQTLFSNMHSGMIMDCPHRERLPYTGDGKLVMKSAIYNLDAVDYYYKWFWDILDAQSEQGLIPNSAPYFGGGGGYAWGNALCTVSKLLYCFTADQRVAQQGYEALVKWLSYYETKRDEDYIIRSNSHTWMLGDWLSPQVVTSNVYYISTVCYLQAVRTALFLAPIVSPEDCGKWKTLEASVISGINRVFFCRETCTYGNGVQGENMLALAEGLVPDEYRIRMEQDLRHHYSVETDYHLDTGIVLTPVLLDYLTEHGCRDIAWKIMTATTYPSYYNLMEGDTTFSEHWSKKWPDYYFGEPGNSRLVKGGGDLSHCHPMYGSVAAWLYEKVAGLDMTRLYQKQVWVTPYFMDQLSWAEATKKTAFGPVRVSWFRKEGYVLELEIPQGLDAICRFPAYCESLVNEQNGQIYLSEENGYYEFKLPAGIWRIQSVETL